MLEHSKNDIQRHLRTHSERSAEDNAAISTLEFYLRSGGRINTDFSKNDKWPNHDGTFELVPDPDVSRQPAQSFYVQVKGSHTYKNENGIIKYSLTSLAFPAFAAREVTLDPCILFVVLDPDCRDRERVFWKYMSVDYLNSIDFCKNSTTITFSAEDELFNTEESIIEFSKKLESISSHHLFVNKLSSTEISKDEICRIIDVCNKQIVESIELMSVLSLTRDDVSKRILPRLNDMCNCALLLNSIKLGTQKPTLQLAWEQAILNIDTKYLASFLKGLKYIDNRIPEDGQSERLMLKYYNFLWQIRAFLKKDFGIAILHNLEKFPLQTDKLDEEYYKMVAASIESHELHPRDLSESRFYIVKTTPFFIGAERYYEITLQLAGSYATKYNRITAYTKENVSSEYSIKIGYVEIPIELWGISTNIKVITNWSVSIDPSSINKLGKIITIGTRINSRYNEYTSMMRFLTKSGINLVDLIDLNEESFSSVIEPVFSNCSTSYLKELLRTLNRAFSKSSTVLGKNVVRFILLNLHEETILNVMYTSFSKKKLGDLYLSSKCYPFEKNPFISNLAGSNTSAENRIQSIIDITGTTDLERVRPYLAIKRLINTTGEIYFDISEIASEEEIKAYNQQLDSWEVKQGYSINVEKEVVCIESYEQTTLFILKRLIEFSKKGNKGQKELNQSFLKNSGIDFSDELKKISLRDVFVNSRILLIYGAAGTGKTTLMNYISNLVGNQRKLFLTKTHSAKQNLQRRIDNPGKNSDFISIDSFNKKVSLPDYDVVFVDECSIIDNKTMYEFLSKISNDTFIVLAGDIYQIESIDFGNWFFYAKEIINTPGANIELLNTWRTEDKSIISLWNEVRNKGPIITEKLAMDGPFSDELGEKIFAGEEDDEIVLCLNYDGKFGLNNMNSYFQNRNQQSEAVSWYEWKYKIGDHILFNESKRFNLLYNNLKGKIVGIDKGEKEIAFTVDVSTNLTEKSCKDDGIEFISASEDTTRIKFSVFANEDDDEDDDNLRMMSVVPFQLAYAVAIHKAQGLEYDSVKVVIPRSNSEKITHGVFYTAITRAKKKLKIFWDAEIMTDVINSFTSDQRTQRSLDIIRHKLSQIDN